jgi:hypothetical protein
VASLLRAGKIVFLPFILLPLVLRVLSRFAIAVGGTPPAPDPNCDYVVLEYFIAGRPLHIGLYVDKLGAATSTAGNPDFAYSSSGTFFGLQTVSNEGSLQETCVNFLAEVKKLYDDNVNFSIRSVWKRDNAHVLQEVFPTAGLGPENGIGGSQSPAVVTPDETVAGCFSEHVLTTRTGHGNKFRINLIAAAPTAYAKPASLVPDAGGTPYERLAAYLTSGDCRIQGHGGGKLLPQFRMHVGPNIKLRRSFNWA